MCPTMADVLGLLLLLRWLITEQATTTMMATFGIGAGRLVEQQAALALCILRQASLVIRS